MIGERALKSNKKYIWNKDQELVIQHPSGDGPVTLKLVDRPLEDADDMMGDFGDADEWTESGSEDTSSTAGRKRSRKVKRAEKPKTEETTPESSGGDGFDW